MDFETRLNSNETAMGGPAVFLPRAFRSGSCSTAFPVYFRIHGMSLTEIGLLSVVGLPWTLKFLWAPLGLTLVGSRRSWIVTCQGLLALDLGLLLFLDPTATGSLAWGGLDCACPTGGNPGYRYRRLYDRTPGSRRNVDPPMGSA